MSGFVCACQWLGALRNLTWLPLCPHSNNCGAFTNPGSVACVHARVRVLQVLSSSKSLKLRQDNPLLHPERRLHPHPHCILVRRDLKPSVPDEPA